MKKQAPEKEMQETTLLPEYGRKKLFTYAESFMQLARSFYGMTKEETERGRDGAVLRPSRETYLWQKRLMENRELLADHLFEMAKIMTGLATEAFQLQPAGDKERYRIARELKKQGN